MWRYLGRTILERLLLLVLISIVSHAVVHLAPGSPTDVDSMNPMMKAEDVLKIRKSFHLDEPLHVQYGYWLRDLFSGELRSFRDINYTHIYKGEHDSLDHVLVYEQFYDHSEKRLWTFREMGCWNDHLVEDLEPGATDHGLVRARFDYNPAG